MIFNRKLYERLDDLADRIARTDARIDRIKEDVGVLLNKAPSSDPRIQRALQLAGEAREDVDMLMTKVQADAAYYRARLTQLEKSRNSGAKRASSHRRK